MDVWKKYKSPLGYETNNGGIDSYGVDHRGFSVRDEVEYQTARNNRENQIIDYYNNQGITENYPQYTTNFWGSPDNNYGFGSSNITDAISAHPAMNTTPLPLQPVQTSMSRAQSTSSWSDGYDRGINDYQQAQMRGSFMSGVNSGYGGYTENNGITGVNGSSSESSSSLGTNSVFGTTSGLQTQIPTPWSTSAAPRYTTSTPWNNQSEQVTPVPWRDNYLTEAQRIQALKNGQQLNLYMQDSQNANYEWPWYTMNWLGKYYVDKHNNDIEKYAMQNNIDPDLVRAVMYNEGATGHKGVFNYLGDLIGASGSQMPMNIQGQTWGDFNGKHYDSYIPQQNIELGTKVLKQMQNSLNNPTPDRIGTLWNETGANNINDVGARVKTAYETKPWLGEKQWEQKLLEFFFGNKKK